jgi:Ca-activated chloride channel family protein
MNAQEPPASENKTAEYDSVDLPEFRIGVRVDLVMLYASIMDKNNHFVSGLEQSRFRVFENGVEQKIESFAQEDVPVSMGIVLDLSGSMRGKIEQVNRAALAFLQAGNPGDEFFLIGFNDDVELLQDYTGDIDEISDAMENTVVVGKTLLYDAIYLGVEKAQSGARSKKALVVITDGNDDTSYFSLKELIAKIQESNVQVFCVGLLDERPKRNIFGRWADAEAKKYHDALVGISEGTGGKAFFPQETAEIRDAVNEIARDLRGQYSIGYFSSNTARDGAFRTVKIEMTGKKIDGVTIRHRRGYFAPEK